MSEASLHASIAAERSMTTLVKTLGARGKGGADLCDALVILGTWLFSFGGNRLLACSGMAVCRRESAKFVAECLTRRGGNGVEGWACCAVVLC